MHRFQAIPWFGLLGQGRKRKKKFHFGQVLKLKKQPEMP